MRLLVTGGFVIGLTACPGSGQPNTVDASIAPGPPNCAAAISVMVPGPAVTVNTCTGYTVNVPNCHGLMAKGLVVEFFVTPSPGGPWLVQGPSSQWLTALNGSCAPTGACAPGTGFYASGRALVEDPSGGCGQITIAPVRANGIGPSGALPVEALDGVDHATDDRRECCGHCE